MKNKLFYLLLTAIAMFGLVRTTIAQTCITNATSIEKPYYATDFERDSYVTVSSPNTTDGMQDYMDEDFTLEFWVYPQWGVDEEKYEFMFGYGKWDDDLNSFSVSFTSVDLSGWAIRVSDGNDSDGNSDLIWEFTKTEFTNNYKNKWNHICVSFDSPTDTDADGTIRLYVNGSLKKTQTSFDLLSYGSGDGDYNSQKYCFVGEGLGSSSAGDHNETFYGYMSGFRLWKKTLSSTEIGYVYQKSFEGIETFPSDYSYLHSDLIVNMCRTYDDYNVYSTTSGTLGIGMTEHDLSTNYNLYHPSNPPKVYNLTKDETCDDIKLYWDKEDHGTAYVYKKRTSAPAQSSYTLLCKTNSNYYIDTDVFPGEVYEYMIDNRWYNPNDPLNYDSGIYNSENEYITASMRKLPAAQNFFVSDDASMGNCNGRVELKWDAIAPAPSGYYIHYKVLNGSWNTLVSDLTATEYIHNVDPNDLGKSITYKVDGEGDGCVNFSSEITGAGNEICATVPTNVVSVEENGDINVTWNFTQVGAPATAFRLYKSTDGGTFEIIESSIDISVREYLDEDATMCVPYAYKIEAYNQCGASGSLSAASNVTVLPSQFDNIFTFNANPYFDASKGYFNNKITLEWTANQSKISDINAYEIYRKLNGESYSLLATINNGNASTYNDFTAEANMFYEYKIRAIGDCNGTATISDSLVALGFRMNTGIVSGKITFEGGNAVENVEVKISSDEVPESSSLYFDGVNDFISTDDFSNDSLFHYPLTVESWIKPEAMLSGQRNIYFSIQNSLFYIGLKDMEPIVGINTNSIGCGSELPVARLDGDTILQEDTWYHISVTFDPAIGTIILYLNGEELKSLQYSNPQVPWAIEDACAADYSNYSVHVGTGGTPTNMFTGNIDELRIWKKVKTANQIAQDYSRLLTGKEGGLIGYYHFNEGFSNSAYDISKTGTRFNKNDLTMLEPAKVPEWSSDIPSYEQLHPAGITDNNGNYLVEGVQYQGAGGVFNVVPTLGVHEFNPSDINLFIGDASPVHNNINFTDQSAFQVTGIITYENTNMPVQGAFIKIDGNFIQGSNNQVVVTDQSGQFDIQVPIGQHYLSIEKQGHTFVSAYYPLQTSSNSITKFFFNEPIYNLKFYDNTTVKLAGRVVGGSVEAAKPLGSNNNPTQNNLGVCRVTFRTEQDYMLDLESEASVLAVNTNSITGLYEINLPPEVYIIDTVKVSPEYNFLDGESESINLTNCFDLKYTIDSLESEENVYSLDTAYVYNLEKNWIWRSTPQISVDNLEGTKFLGDSIYFVNGAIGGVDTIQVASLIAGDAYYAFGKPIYSLGKKYNLLIAAFETYTNSNTLVVDTVIISDGEVIIVNECSNSIAQISLDFNENGQTLYQFFGGFPNLSSPYTKKLEIKLKIGDAYYDWSESPLYGYVSGSIPTGSNFVTQGPTSIDFVLRDPPGSGSHSSMQEGTTIVKTSTSAIKHGQSGSESLNYHLGTKVVTNAGSPFFTVTTEYEMENNIGIGIEHSENWNNELEETTTVKFSQSFSTSDDPSYVGEMGDLFLGHGNNIIYGLSNFIQVINVEDIPVGGETINDTVALDGKQYTIGKRSGLNLGKEVSTTFVYTQNHIENYLIPNLKMLRNMAYDSNPQYYTIVFADIDDDKFLSNNDDEFIWGSQASDSSHIGPSYIFSNPLNDDLIDTVRYYNNQINEWIDVLRDNEIAKLNSVDDSNFPSNISFDAGAIYEAEVTIDSLSKTTDSFEFTISPAISGEFGFQFCGSGLTLKFEEKYNYSNTSTTVDETTESQTISFSLADDNQGDYFSVDIRKDTIGGFGPIFKTVGGQSSCPYEGANYTEYYQPGTLLSQATMQIEVPDISVDNNVIAGVPETQAAIFNVAMANNSEVNSDAWYILYVNPASNPHGAVIKMDGAPISGNSMAILVPAGQTVYKALTFEKGQPDINDYENIQIIMHSECQFDPTDDVADIADTILISAHFSPTCTEVSFGQIYDDWTVNNVNNDTLSFVINGYNLNSTKFKSISFQYAVPGGPRTTNMVFYKSETDFNAASEPKMWINGSTSIQYNFALSNLIDGNYQLYLKTTCNDDSEFVTEPLSGIIDRVLPSIFGTPQPSDGILSHGEDISVMFNEQINAGDLYSHVDYVEVRGMTNGTDLTSSPYLLHDASIHFDGIENNLQVNNINLDHTDFTIEFWAKRDDVGRACLASLGTPSQSGLWIGFDESNHFVVELDNQTVVSSQTYDQSTQWAFYSLTYSQGSDESGQGLSLYVLSDASGTPEYTEIDVNPTLEGTLSIGYCPEDQSAFNGNIHEFRIWNYARLSSEVSSQKGQILNGYEAGLYSLWPMNEASGNVVKDIAFGRNAILEATWHVSRDGKALAFDGTNVFSVPAGEMAFDNQSDFTVEFWYKMATPTSNVSLLSNGNPEQESNINSWNITATSNQELVVSNNGVDVVVDAEDFMNNQWHHFALSMNRIGFLSVYLDGNLVKTNNVNPFEGFGGGRLVAGARWYSLNSIEYYDQYMLGVIDEIRVWNAARTQDQIKRYMNYSLHGDEYGLKAYFPFEDVTIEDPSISNENSGNFTLDTDGVAGDTLLPAIVFTSESPNVKLQRPEVSIPHTYTINNDKIIITPTIQDNLIENQILDISVKRVKDMNNNRMSSTLTWSAFIDKNQVVWDVQNLLITKFVEDETTVVVNVQNKGGLNENFQISNIPDWMEVNPSSGSLIPMELAEIEITIKPELNIGSYQRDINLTASMDYNERLGISVQVNGHPPIWTVNPDIYEHSANLIGQLSVNNVLSTDVNDIVACFVGDECRGVAHVQYFAAADIYLLFMNIYDNNTYGSNLTFKVYDASTGEVYVDVSPSLVFESNVLFGSVNSPIQINSLVNIAQEINLASGWNWISYYVYSPNFNQVNLVLADLDAQTGDQIKAQSSYLQNSNNLWLGSLGSFDNENLYKFRVNTAQSFTVTGESVSAESISIQIDEGWNWISYPLRNQSPINSALSSLNVSDGDLIKSQTKFAVFDSGLGWIGTLEFLSPGKGYMMKALNPSVLEYPSGVSGAKSTTQEDFYEYNYDPASYQGNMTMIAEVLSSNIDVSVDDKIYVFVNDECRGLGKPVDISGRQYFFITLNGDINSELVSFVLHHDGQVFAINETEEFIDNSQRGTLYEPVPFTLAATSSNEINSLVLCRVGPNPFVSEISFIFDESFVDEKNVEIYNSLGDLVVKLSDIHSNIIVWNGSSSVGTRVSPGVYYAKISSANQSQIVKICKTR